MALDLLEVTEPSLAYTVLGGFVVAFSMVSLLVKEKIYLNEVVLGTAFGILMGPYCADIFDPRSWGSHTTIITLEVMRIVLATGLFAIGVELPRSYLADHAKGLSIMVIPTMAFGWIVVAGLIKALFPMYNFVSALAVAACLTPTDPIICAAIVGGKFAIKHVPVNLRRILAAESAANDGLAYPFLSISIYLTVEQSKRVAIGKWFLVGWLYQVILGVLIGTFMGIGFCYLMKYSHRKGFIDRESYIAQYLALALFTIGVASTIGSDDLLAAFAAGSALSWDGHFNVQIENAVFSSVIDLVLNCGCFIYIGAWLPFSSFNSPDLGIVPWKLVILFIGILILRRIPSLLLLYKWVPEIDGWKEALFSGHFGPMGVGAVFISTLALTRLPEPQNPPRDQQEYLAATLQTIVSFIVLGSILIHGLSIPFFSFGKRVHTRTVSLSRTWTSRTTSAPPDWLLWARRAPGPENDFPRSTTITTQHTQHTERNISEVDLESGARSISDTKNANGAAKVDIVGTPINDGLDATVISEQEVMREEGNAVSASGFSTPGYLGEAGMIEDPAERAGSASVRRRVFDSRNDVRDSEADRNRGAGTPTMELTASAGGQTSQVQVVQLRTQTQDPTQDQPDPAFISQKLSNVVRSPSLGRFQLDNQERGFDEAGGTRNNQILSGAQSPTKMVHFPSDQ